MTSFVLSNDARQLPGTSGTRSPLTFFLVGKSLFAMGIIHTAFNGGWQLFPASGNLVVPSFYDPRFLALVGTIAAATVTFRWGPKTLAHWRYDRAGRGEQAV